MQLPSCKVSRDSQFEDNAQTDTSWGSVRGRLSSKNCWAHFQLLEKLQGVKSTLNSWKSDYTWFWKAKWLEHKRHGCTSDGFNAVNLYASWKIVSNLFLKVVIPNIINTNLKYQKLLQCLQKNQHLFSSVLEIVFLWICLKMTLLFYAALSTAFPIFR